jgi:hypothetical protein
MLGAGYRIGLQRSALFMSLRDEGPPSRGEDPADHSDLRRRLAF